ncbi:MAG: hypothetical protein WAM71_16395 [Candidatus Korobacteraceae bacterium]
MKKELLSLAGEHRVASELCKRGIFATITPGNRKQTDIYAINDDTDRFCRIEVKTTQSSAFLTGINQRNKAGKAPEFWVLVLFTNGDERFFVLSNDEIVKLQKGETDKWQEGYRNRHPGKEYDMRTGVDKLPIRVVESSENCWEKIQKAVGAKRSSESESSCEGQNGRA